jgi:hypothetical protein
MMSMRSRFSIIVIFCLVLVCIINSTVYAHDCNCHGCWKCENGGCVWRCVSGQQCCNDHCINCDSQQCMGCGSSGGCQYGCDPNDCHECDGHGNCVSKCPTGEICCDGSCCKGSCCNGQCCASDACKSCVGESCKVCGGDPNQKCCNGECCGKVWTTHTEAISTFCPSCGNGPPGGGPCGGTTTEIGSYEYCVMAEASQGGHCQCNMEMQVVGYTYPCMINWDISRILWCAGRGSWCAAVCISTWPTGSPEPCARCLAGAGTDCCPNGCEVCDFVTACEKNPYDGEEQTSVVFTGFGC